MRIVTKKTTDTKTLAKRLAQKILKSKPDKNAKVIALSGDLGTGKTTFTQGFIRALGSKNRVMSPTFLIFKPYALKSIKYKKVFHFDLYRIGSVREVNALGFQKIISDNQNIVLIEWASKIKKHLPKNTIWINFDHGANEKERIIEIK